MSLKPICVPCQLFYNPKRNGTPLIEGMPHGATWKPYKLWIGDLWECRGCGHQIIVGALSPLAEHYHPDFPEKVRRYAPSIQVNDC